MKNKRRIGLFFIFFSAALILNNCTTQKDEEEEHFMFTNELINETSPYLLQHAHNPVNWFPWNDEALAKAKEENKLMIISVGYSACHWCHVMEHESFEDTSVANLMNETYISIKVDREERPDVDQVYMDAAYIITGRGGWPLNVIALPDGRPVFAGTYFPKDQWVKILTYFRDQFIQQPELFEQEANKLSQYLKQQKIPGLEESQQTVTVEELKTGFNNGITHIDFEFGGTKGAPKFPMPNVYEFFLTYYFHTKDKQALNAVTSLLDNMAKGGIYDQLGGGFARYSTDDKWKVPHFEKMLYDNGQLVSLYSNAYKVTHKENYKKIVYQTLEFIEREMMDPSGGFYSAYDADSEGEEGRFYVWSKEEVLNLLKEDGQLFCDYYTISDSGNWEPDKNILYRIDDPNELLEKYSIDKKTLEEKLSASKRILFEERQKRVKPGLDDKILTSWNALMLKGFIDAYNAFGEKDFLNTALKNAEFISGKMMKEDGQLFRNYKNGKVSINGFLSDYSFTIEAFISLYETTFDEQWLNKAKTLAEYVIRHFKDEESEMFYFTSDIDDSLITRKIELTDNVIPASNSSLAKGLFKLANYFYDKEFKDSAEKMVKKVKSSFTSNPLYYSNWGILMMNFAYHFYEVAIVGSDCESLRSELASKFYPNILVMGTEEEGKLELLHNKLVHNKTMIYVCEDKNCKLPVEDVKDAEKQLL